MKKKYDPETTLFSYVEKANRKFAKTYGKKIYGSQSAYINALITKDRTKGQKHV